MNKELKKYIKYNLKREKKKNKKINIKDILLFPLTLILLPFSHKYKDTSYEEDIDSIVENDNNKGNSDSKKITARSFDFARLEDDDEEEIIHTPKSSLKCKVIFDIDKYLDENKIYNSFQSLLFKMIDDKNLTDSEVYNKVHIDRRLFSKIRNDKDYHPSKETVILLGLSLELSESEIEELLESASYSLPRNNHYDLIIRFCFMKGIYKLSKVNDLLSEYDCKLFNY